MSNKADEKLKALEPGEYIDLLPYGHIGIGGRCAQCATVWSYTDTWCLQGCISVKRLCECGQGVMGTLPEERRIEMKPFVRVSDWGNALRIQWTCMTTWLCWAACCLLAMRVANRGNVGQ